MAHRTYALAPDCYDDGHNEQFEKIQGKIWNAKNIYRNYLMRNPK